LNPAERLAQLGTATVGETAGAVVVELDLIQSVPGSRAAGPARTVMCGQGDNLMVHVAMREVEPGEVLVLTMPNPVPVALFGELLGIQAQGRGTAAVLVDAAMRDVEELCSLGLRVWARWVRVSGASKTARGHVGGPVRVGGAEIHNGDQVVLDRDGVVVVGSGRVGEVLAAAELRAAAEVRKRELYRSGVLSIDTLEKAAETAEPDRGNA